MFIRLATNFQLVGTTRAHVSKKFKDDVHFVHEWTRMFVEQKIS